LLLDLSIVCGILTASGFGTADFVAKLSTGKVGFLRTALFMQAFGSFFVLPFAMTDFSRLLVDPLITLAAILLGVVNALATLLLYKGFEVGRVSIVSPIASTAPMVAIVLAITLLGEMVTIELFAGIGFVLAGIILVSFQTAQIEASKQIAKGAIYAIGFMMLGGFLLFGLKPVSNVLGVFLPVLIMRWVGVPVLAVPFLAKKPSGSSRGAFRLILAIAFFDTFANVIYTVGVHVGTVSIVAPLGGMFSAVTVLFARFFLKERLSLHQIVGFVAIIIGVGILGAFG
jgi:drug/metabolite transporter (DMT)-like permease